MTNLFDKHSIKIHLIINQIVYILTASFSYLDYKEKEKDEFGIAGFIVLLILGMMLSIIANIAFSIFYDEYKMPGKSYCEGPNPNGLFTGFAIAIHIAYNIYIIKMFMNFITLSKYNIYMLQTYIIHLILHSVIIIVLYVSTNNEIPINENKFDNYRINTQNKIRSVWTIIVCMCMVITSVPVSLNDSTPRYSFLVLLLSSIVSYICIVTILTVKKNANVNMLLRIMICAFGSLSVFYSTQSVRIIDYFHNNLNTTVGFDSTTSSYYLLSLSIIVFVSIILMLGQIWIYSIKKSALDSEIEQIEIKYNNYLKSLNITKCGQKLYLINASIDVTLFILYTIAFRYDYDKTAVKILFGYGCLLFLEYISSLSIETIITINNHNFEMVFDPYTLVGFMMKPTVITFTSLIKLISSIMIFVTLGSYEYTDYTAKILIIHLSIFIIVCIVITAYLLIDICLCCAITKKIRSNYTNKYFKWDPPIEAQQIEGLESNQIETTQLINMNSTN